MRSLLCLGHFLEHRTQEPHRLVKEFSTLAKGYDLPYY
jgi:hypothetical protein